MDELGHVSTEGGPLLLIDRDAVGNWSGIDGDDYDRACRLLDHHHCQFACRRIPLLGGRGTR